MISDKELQEIKRVSKIRWDLNTAENTLPKILPWLISCVSTIEELKGEVERLNGLYEDERSLNSAIGVEREMWAEQFAKIRDQVSGYRTALEWYADRRNHPPFWLHDDGERARQALGDSHDHT